ncbi:hypothetical protein PENSPDRAFT_656001 [Peniophora sp. CONT]|nr:hypothetical protein PENSPDRAFT_656001 [Peniophora sp. CONT]
MGPDTDHILSAYFPNQHDMFFRIYNFLISWIVRLLYSLGVRNDSSTAGPDTERGPVECVITENTGLLSHVEDNEREFLTGPDPPTLWRPSAFDYREQSTPSTPSFESAVRVPPADEDISSSGSDEDSDSDSDEPPPYATRGKPTRSRQGHAPSRAPHAFGQGYEARPVRPISGPTTVTISPRPPRPPPPPPPRPGQPHY